MAEWQAGVRGERPKIEPVLSHAWETAYAAGGTIPWDVEPGFGALKWLSS
jgi:hypothetical protein